MSLIKKLVAGFRHLFMTSRDLALRLAAEEGVGKLVEVGRQEGLISETEVKMVEGIFQLKERLVREVMVPRTEIDAVDCNADFKEVVALMVGTGHSRLPAYKESLDNIVGIVYAKDVLSYFGREEGMKVSQVMRPAFFVPETKRALELLQELRKGRRPVAVAVDEYGGVSGLVAMEDLLEEIVGEIRDEHDQDEETVIASVGKEAYLVDARMNLEELEEALSISLPKEEFETVGGLVFHLTGRIPKPGDSLSLTGLRITVESADERRIYKVRIEKMPLPSSEREGEP